MNFKHLHTIFKKYNNMFDIFKVIYICKMHSEIQMVLRDIEEASMHNIKLNPIRIKHGKYRGLLLFHQLCFFFCEWIYNTCLCRGLFRWHVSDRCQYCWRQNLVELYMRIKNKISMIAIGYENINNIPEIKIHRAT